MEQFQRLNMLIDSSKLESKTIAIIGVGGVGGYVTESLARSNIGTLILVDFDTIDITNINRQIIATTDSIGNKKVDEFKKRINSINPNCNVITYDLFLDESNIKKLFANKIDFLVDACDSIKTKEALIMECINRNIPFITSMGTGNRIDSSKLVITKLSKTSGDPIARIMRKWVKDNNISKEITVVTSLELPIKTGERKPGSTVFVPASAGLLIGSYVVRYFIDK